MEIRTLGRTDLKVFTIGLGTGTLGCKTVEDFIAVYGNRRPDVVNEDIGISALTFGIASMIQSALNAGYSVGDARILIDTAALYGNRRSERIIGKVLRDNPTFGRWILVTTKAGKTFHSNMDYSIDAIKNSIDLSSQLTGIDRFEIIYLHDPMGLSEETVYNARDQLEIVNVVDHIGIAANDPDTNKEYIKSGLFPVAVVPETTSLINRRIEHGILQAAAAYNVGLIAATAIEKGYLTNNPPDTSVEMLGRNFSKDCLNHMEEVREKCREMKTSTTTVAAQWPIHAYPEVAVSLIGISGVMDARDADKAQARIMSNELWGEIEPLAVHFDEQRTTADRGER